MMKLPASEVPWWYSHRDPAPAISTAAHRESEGATAFAAVVVFTFILLLAPQTWFPVLASLRIAFLAAGAAAVFLLWDRWRHGRLRLGLTSEMLLGLGIAGWAILTLPLSYWPGGSLEVLSEPYIKALTVFWLLGNVVTSSRRLRLLASLMILCTVPLSVTAMKNVATGTYVTGGASMGRILGYQAGIALNPNDLALVLNLLMPLGIALFLSTEKTSVRVLWLVILGVNVVGVILTMSRAGFLGLALIGLVYFFKLVRRPGRDRSWAFVMLLLAILSVPMLPSSYVDRMATITKIEADPTGSAQARWRDTFAAIRFVVKHPIVGAGIGMDILALNEVRGARWNRVHNVYLQYAVDLGLPGLVLFLLMFYGVFRAALTSRRRVSQVPELRDLFLLAEALEVSLVVFAVSGFFYPVAYHFYFYYIAGLVLATRSAADAAVPVTNSSMLQTATPPPFTMVRARTSLLPAGFHESHRS